MDEMSCPSLHLFPLIIHTFICQPNGILFIWHIEVGHWNLLLLITPENPIKKSVHYVELTVTEDKQFQQTKTKLNCFLNYRYKVTTGIYLKKCKKILSNIFTYMYTSILVFIGFDCPQTKGIIIIISL